MPKSAGPVRHYSMLVRQDDNQARAVVYVLREPLHTRKYHTWYIPPSAVLVLTPCYRNVVWFSVHELLSYSIPGTGEKYDYGSQPAPY